MLKRIALAVGFVVAVFALLVGAVAVQNHSRGDALVEDVVALSAPRPRPIHRQPPLPGTFPDCIAPLVDQAADGGSLSATARQFQYSTETVYAEVASALDGGMSVGALSAETRARLDQLSPWADGMVACTRTPAVAAVDGIGPFADWTHPRASWAYFFQAATRTSLLAARRELSDGKADDALRRCGDLLALARDLPLERGLIGAMFANATTKMVFPVCTDAIAAASPSARMTLKVELETIQERLPTFSDVLRIERAQMQLALFGRYLSRDQFARLPSESLQLAQSGAGVHSTWQVVASWLFWSSYLRRLDRLIAAAAAPDRDVELTRIEAERDAFSLIFSESGGGSPWTKFARRYDNVGRGFELLQSAIRVMDGAETFGAVRRRDASDGVTLSIDWNTSVAASELIAVRIPRPVPR